MHSVNRSILLVVSYSEVEHLLKQSLMNYKSMLQQITLYKNLVPLSGLVEILLKGYIVTASSFLFLVTPELLRLCLLSLGTAVFSNVLAGYRPISHQRELPSTVQPLKQQFIALATHGKHPGALKYAGACAHPPRGPDTISLQCGLACLKVPGDSNWPPLHSSSALTSDCVGLNGSAVFLSFCLIISTVVFFSLQYSSSSKERWLEIIFPG